MHFSFSIFSVFLAIIQVKQCLCLIFHVIQFSFHFLGPKVCFSHIFFKIFSVSHRISHPTVCVSYFPWYSVFSPYSRLYSVHFSFCTFFIVSCHIPGRTGFVSHFSPFWVFLAIFHFLLYLFSFSMIFSFLVIFPVLECAFLIFHFFSVSCHNPGQTMFVSHFSRFSVFFPLSWSYSVFFSYFFKVFSVSHCISHPTVCVSHFPRYSVFLPYSRSYIVHLKFSTFFSVSFHIPFHAVFVSHFPCFSVFLAIIHVLQCVFLSFHDFQYSRHIPGNIMCITHFPRFECFLPYSMSYSVWFSFSMIFSFLNILLVL